MNKGRSVIKRKCINWFNSLPDEERHQTFENIEFKLCVHLKQGYSGHMSKALTRNELHYGYVLMDYVYANSDKIKQFKKILKTQPLGS